MSDRPGSKASNDVYTILLGLAAILVGSATLALAMRSAALFGTWNPL